MIIAISIMLAVALIGLLYLTIERCRLRNSLQHLENSVSLRMAEIQVGLEEISCELQKPKTLSEEQLELKRKLDASWKALYDEQAQSFEKELAAQRASFGGLLDKRYQEAVEKINFQVIEYKKEIQKRRRKASKQQPSVSGKIRSIDEEE